MNRKNLTSAVLAGLAGAAGIAASAQAVNINPDGLGQVLIYPYYTTRAGNMTLLSVVNTTENAKAVKVRFMEGRNTREVLDFNLYMSPYDVWTAALIDGGVVDADCALEQTPDVPWDDDTGQCGIPHMLTTDTTCTVPYLFAAASTAPGLQAFLPYRLTDGGETIMDRTAEGHFEMIEMGTLVDREWTSASDATHVNGTPADCQALVDAWTVGGTPADNGYWVVDPLDDIDPPSGGLFGGAAVVNAAEGFMVSYDAKAINGFATVEDPNGLALHAEPGTTLPNLNSGDVLDATVFLDDGTTLVSSGLTRGVDAVSFVFMHDQVMNEYSTEDSINGFTEWVVTFPTKHFYVYQPDAGPLVPIAPFTQEWVDLGTPAETEMTACEVVLLDGIYDREENTPTEAPPPGQPPIVSPAPPTPPGDPIIPFELCFETNIIRFGAEAEDEGDAEGGGGPTEIFGSTNFTNFDTDELGYETGWVRIQMDDYPNDVNGDGVVDTAEAALSRDPLGGLEGLPVTGFAAQKFGNLNAADGVAAFYGGIYQHKGTRAASS